MGIEFDIEKKFDIGKGDKPVNLRFSLSMVANFDKNSYFSIIALCLQKIVPFNRIFSAIENLRLFIFKLLFHRLREERLRRLNNI